MSQESGERREWNGIYLLALAKRTSEGEQRSYIELSADQGSEGWKLKEKQQRH